MEGALQEKEEREAPERCSPEAPQLVGSSPQVALSIGIIFNTIYEIN